MYELDFAISGSVITVYKIVENIFSRHELKCSIFESAIVIDKGVDFTINQGIKVVVYEEEETSVKAAVEDLKAAIGLDKVYVKKEVVAAQKKG